jgi:peptidoglycan/xylan/chitin deacetylase (PgdA/CDA1 family)/SAM-dependent methyltransferase
VNKPEVDTWALSVSPELFLEQVSSLRAVAEPYTLTEIAVGLLRGNLPHNAVAVTFDDGYLNNLLNAKPILEQFEIPATVFVCAGWIGRDDELWWDQLERALFLTMNLPNRLELNVNGQHFEWNVLPDHNDGNAQASPSMQFGIDDFPSRLKLYRDVWEVIRRLPPSLQIEAVQKISAWSGARPEARDGYRPMNAQELVDIAAGGLIEIGGHTVFHPLLPAHSSSFQRHEILDGKLQLERILGTSIDTFAYPNGEYDQASLDIVREAGFLCACTTVDNVCTLGTSIYELPRLGVRNWGGQEFTNIVSNRLGLQEKRPADFSKREFQTLFSNLHTKAPPLELTEPTISAGAEADRPKAASTAKVSFGDLSVPLPLSDDWGFSRGSPIDRFFIERFLARHQGDIGGHVLEVGDNTYTKRFGANRVSVSDVVDVRADNPRASIIADLRAAPNIPSDKFDCIILTQVLDEIEDVEAALATVSRILKPGGVALITVPGISQISSNPEEASKWSWSFYPRTLQQLLAKFFYPKKLIVEGFGNLKTTIGFLAGLAQEDLASDDFLLHDHRYPLIVAARAVKPGRLPQVARRSLISENPQVSVVMPVYNAAPFLAEAIESVLCQRSEDWELLIVDDGSTDASHEIAEDYAKTYPYRIRLSRHPDSANHGLSRTLNLGIAQARADILAFLDADDIWLSDRLTHDLDMLRRNPSACGVFSNSLYWWYDKSGPARVNRYNSPVDCVWPKRAFFRSAFLRNESSVPCPSALTVRSEMLRQIGGFDETLDVAQDLKLISELSFRFPVCIAARCNSEYRRHGDSLWSSSMTDGRDAACRRRYWQWIWELVKREAGDEPQLLEELVATLSRPAMTQLVGRRIIWEDEKVGSSHRGPGNAGGQRSARLLLDPGRYILNAQITEMAGSEHSIGVEVSSDDGRTRFARSRVPVAEIRATRGRVGVFEVRPPSKNIVLTIIPYGPAGVCFRGIDVVAEDWPFQTAEFVIHPDAGSTETH